MALPKNYHDPQYKLLCEQESGYRHPGDQWFGATLVVKVEDGLVLIKRSATMPSHANQWGVFGGRKNEHETNPVDVAVREFTEESFLKSGDLNIKGLLPPVYTAKNQIIIPVVSKYERSLDEFLTTVKSNGEWDYGVWVPLTDLTNESLWNYGNRYGVDTASQILFFDIEQQNAKFFGDFTKGSNIPLLWGATARMVWNFVSLCYIKEE